MADGHDLTDFEEKNADHIDGLRQVAEKKARDALTEEVVRDITIIGGTALLGWGIWQGARYLSPGATTQSETP